MTATEGEERGQVRAAGPVRTEANECQALRARKRKVATDGESEDRQRHTVQLRDGVPE